MVHIELVDALEDREFDIEVVYENLSTIVYSYF